MTIHDDDRDTLIALIEIRDSLREANRRAPAPAPVPAAAPRSAGPPAMSSALQAACDLLAEARRELEALAAEARTDDPDRW